MFRRFRDVYLLGDRDDDRDRIFVELWDTKDWPDVVAHLKSLKGVMCVTSHEERPNAPGLTFVYCDHTFSFYRGCGDYMGVVEDPHCPDEILLRVAHHMNHLLCPITKCVVWRCNVAPRWTRHVRAILRRVRNVFAGPSRL